MRNKSRWVMATIRKADNFLCLTISCLAEGWGCSLKLFAKDAQLNAKPHKG